MQLFLLMIPALLMGLWIGYETGKEAGRNDAVNAKQSLKIVSQKLAEAEDYIAKCKADITMYNECIDGMIAGKSPCDWCEEQKECELQAKAEGKGCDQWWLMYSN